MKTMKSEEVCEVLQITRKTLQKWERQGKIPFTQIGHRHLYLVEDIEKIIYDNYRR